MKKIMNVINRYNNNSNPTFIYNLWEFIFKNLQKITLFDLLRTIFPGMKSNKDRFVWVEIWVVLNLLLSISSLMIINTDINLKVSYFLSYFFIIYGVLRVFEIGVTQINILLFSNSSHEVRSYKRTIILLFHNYIEIVMWFTSSYLFFSNEFDMMATKSFIEIMYISFMTMASFQSSLKPISDLGYYLISFQTITGLLLTLICLARFIPLLNNPVSLDHDEMSVDNETKQLILELVSANKDLTNRIYEQELYLKELKIKIQAEESIIFTNVNSELNREIHK